MTRVRVKICGVTNPVDAAFAIDAGADAVGLNFYPKSPRYLPVEMAEWVSYGLPMFAVKAGVFVDATPELIDEYIQRFHLAAAQTYGPTPTGRIFETHHMPAFRVRDAADLDVVRREVERVRPQAVLIDSFVAGEVGGTGHRAPWHLLAGFDPGVPVILAGGLTPDNVAEAIRVVRPWGVDVASGVESAPGRKDPAKVAAFVAAVRAAGS